jgi:hypothetical protein
MMRKKLAVIAVLLVAALLMGASITSTLATGARTTGAVVQNLGDDPATVRLDYYNQAGGLVVYTETVIQPASAVGFGANNQTGLADGFVGSMVVSADQPIAAIGNDTDSDSVGFYSAVTEGATKLYVPALYKGYGNWFSEIWIQAVETVPAGATATITFKDRQGNQTGTVKTVNLTTYATIKVSPSDYADIPADNTWAGGAVIESSYKMGAVIRNTRDTGATGMIAEEYNAFSSGDTQVYVPAIYKSYGVWNSNGINVQNLGTQTTTVSIDFYDRLGAKTTTYNFPSAFAANGGVSAVNTKNIADADLPLGWAGTAVIKSNNGQPVIGIVDVTSTDQGKGNVYNAVLASDGATTVYLPSQYKRFGGWRSGVIAMNLDPTPAVITFEFYARGATTTSAVTSTTVNQYIAFAKNTLNADLGLPDGWSGTVVVKSVGGNVVVVGNVDGGFDARAGLAGMYNAFPKKP